MKICDINPFIRFAEEIYIKRKPSLFNVFDCRIFAVKSGELKIKIDNTTYILHKNDIFYCASGSKYTISSKEIACVLSLNFDLSQNRKSSNIPIAPVKITEEMDTVPYLQSDYIDDCLFLNTHLHLKNAYYFCEILNHIISEYNEKRIFYSEKSSTILKNIIFEMYRINNEKSTISQHSIDIVIAYINSNYPEKINNSYLAKLIGYHEYHLNRIFKEKTGKTVHQYVIEVRLNAAKHLLLSSDLSLMSIAEKVGFSNDAHFSNSFKNHFGYSPLDYKNQFKNRI